MSAPQTPSQAAIRVLCIRHAQQEIKLKAISPTSTGTLFFAALKILPLPISIQNPWTSTYQYLSNKKPRQQYWVARSKTLPEA